ncbi:acyl-CoA dehydrogenase [Tistrella bauzanensis]|uniref:Acyl-CoA dehydrogenase n=1 Tax=Tistrella bauzanensis TaxID=657419 RepID=A0ABQ1I897_9PROT|nr:isovaleryl-CoA dehydrogenase [Tistrella bauzanensis]GGB23937.1 acyl-CoA dehydrogenase [Tistrella bauzanensis]
MTDQTPLASSSSSPSPALAPAAAPGATHAVFNQVPLLEANLYAGDQALGEAVEGFGGGWARGLLSDYGARTGGPMLALGHDANRFPPELTTHDRYGNRIDEVRFHPAYHALMAEAVGAGMHSLAWTDPRPGAMVARSALVYMHCQAEAGTMCPMTMTFAVVPALKQEPAVAERWLPGVLSTQYDPRAIPAPEKAGLTLGMAMTEKQGGSDVRANTTRAVRVGEEDGQEVYELTGHKWFCSAPMCDGFLVLAQTDAGVTCFLMPRRRPDGSRNAMHIQRLKDKVGNRSNASSEIELRGAYAVRVGPEGRGVRTIIEMVHHTRLDCALGASGLMRQALTQAIHHARHRQAFGARLVDQPAMRNVLADLALEQEAGMRMVMRLAHSFEQSGADPQEQAFARIATAVVKYWVCKRAPGFIYEAMECLGGNGYVEESGLPRLYREAPLNAIWEGSGNVIALDVLRALGREPATREALAARLMRNRGADARYDAHLDRTLAALGSNADLEFRARRLVGDLGLALAGAELIDHAPETLAEAWLASRLGGDHGGFYGTLPTGTDAEGIISRAAVAA